MNIIKKLFAAIILLFIVPIMDVTAQVSAEFRAELLKEGWNDSQIDYLPTKTEFSKEYKMSLKGAPDDQIRIQNLSKAMWDLKGIVTDKALKIGDLIPDIEMIGIYNYPGGKARISDFKGKLLILDFWSRGCKSCIAAFPKMEELQLKFKDRLQVLAVTPHSKETYNINEPDFPKGSTSSILRDTKLPMVFYNLGITEAFPHFSQPYYAWIDQNGRVLALTDGSSVSERNIQDVLDGKKVPFTLSMSYQTVVYPKEYFSFDTQKSLLEEGGGRNVPDIVYLKRSVQNRDHYVILAKVGLRVGYRFGRGWKSGETDVRAVHLRDIRGLFVEGYLRSDGKRFDTEDLIIEAVNEEKFYPDWGEGRQEWLKKYTYSLEYALPGSTEGRKFLQDALTEYFQITATVEKRNLKCLILKKTGNTKKLEESGSGLRDYTPSRNHFVLKNAGFKDFVGMLKKVNLSTYRDKAMPIVDETGLRGNFVNLDVENLSDHEGLNDQLKKYGLSLIKEERDIEVLVLKEHAFN